MSKPLQAINRYKADLREMNFLMFEQFKLGEILGKGRYESWGEEDVRHALDIGRSGKEKLEARSQHPDDLAATLSFLDRGALDSVVADFLEEVRIADVACAGDAAGVELLEHSEQHHGDDEPYGNFGKPLIVQTKLQSITRSTENKKGTVGTQLAFILGFSTRKTG